MRTAETVLGPPISGTANAATAIANAATAFPGTLRQFAAPAGEEWSVSHDSGHAPNIPSGLAITPEAIP
jgi:hypothetical protein